MMHLAYPNILGVDTWSGCGRYLSLPRDQEAPQTGYSLARPNGGNIVHLLRAARHFAPTGDDAIYPAVYEQENRRNAMHRGFSLELAYCLAVIRCVRRLRLEPFGLLGDVWCTGRIQEHSAQTFWLTPVDQAVFSAKLRAFLAAAQDPYHPAGTEGQATEDRLFLVPALNFAFAPEYAVWCLSAGASVFRLQEWASTLTSTTTAPWDQRKTVVTIHEDELALLVDTLFEKPPLATATPSHHMQTEPLLNTRQSEPHTGEPWQGWRGWPTRCATYIWLGSLGLVLVLAGLLVVWMRQLPQALVDMHVLKRSLGSVSVLKPGDKLTAWDRYEITLTPRHTAYVYVYQIDTRGDVALLFPNPDWTPEVNPIPAGKAIRIPHDPEKAIGLRGPQGREVLIVGASQQIVRAPVQAPRHQLDSFLERMEYRYRLEFQNSTPAPDS